MEPVKVITELKKAEAEEAASRRYIAAYKAQQEAKEKKRRYKETMERMRIDENE